MKKIYIAGPMVFLENSEDVFAEMKSILRKYDLLGVAPIDNQIGLEGVQPGDQLNTKIYEADVGIMEGVDGAIFNISPFRRGVEMDAGTAFEVGYCRALKLPMTGWTTDIRTYPDIVADFFRSNFYESLHESKPNSSGATSGGLRDPDGNLVHSAGLSQNLMIQKAIETSGGRVIANSDWRVAFEQSVGSLSSLLKGLKPSAGVFEEGPPVK